MLLLFFFFFFFSFSSLFFLPLPPPFSHTLSRVAFAPSFPADLGMPRNCNFSSPFLHLQFSPSTTSVSSPFSTVPSCCNPVCPAWKNYIWSYSRSKQKVISKSPAGCDLRLQYLMWYVTSLNQREKNKIPKALLCRPRAAGLDHPVSALSPAVVGCNVLSSDSV